MNGRAATSRACTAAGLALLGILLGASAFRASLPSNRGHHGLDLRVLPDGSMEWGTGNGYDDAVTVATARNFAREGFLRTHLLPNRARAPLTSWLDVEQKMCHHARPAQRVILYMNVIGKPVEMDALAGDCIYTHYPPLADWFFGALASAGLDQVLTYKLVAIFLNGLFLVLFHLWLRREVREPAALLALALVAASPAVLQWTDALFYQPFQYLFLAAGMLSWTSYLRRPRPSRFALTWLLFLLESLVSLELVLFYGIVLAGLAFLERRPERVGARLKLLAIQASAPLAAFLLHFGLRASLLGLGPSWSDLTETYRSRAVGVLSAHYLPLAHSKLSGNLLPLSLFGLGLAAVVVQRRLTGGELRRPLALLGILLAGGLSFTALVPGTALFHYWSMYRHFMPFTVLLLALLADGFPALAGPLRGWRARPLPAAGFAGLLLLGAVPLGWAAFRDAREIRLEVAWNRERDRHADPDDLIPRFQDVLYWKESGRGWDPSLVEAVDGRRVNPSARRSGEFQIHRGSVSHFEIWWLEPIELKTVLFLTSGERARDLAEECFLSFFDGGSFRQAGPDVKVAFDPFVPDPGEPPPPVPYSWVRFSLPSPVASRVARLTCGGLEAIPLHEISAFSR
jgi:hypothetical protein